MWFKKTSPRRQAIREELAETGAPRRWWSGKGYMFLVAGVFFLVATAVQFWPRDPFPFREGEAAPTDLRAPVDFTHVNPKETEMKRAAAHDASLPVLEVNDSAVTHICILLSNIKTDLDKYSRVADVPRDLLAQFTNPDGSQSLTDDSLKALRSYNQESYGTLINSFRQRELHTVPIVTSADYDTISQSHKWSVWLALDQTINKNHMNSAPFSDLIRVVTGPGGHVQTGDRDKLRALMVQEFPRDLWEPITNCLMRLKEPTFSYSNKLTAELADEQARSTPEAGDPIPMGRTLVKQGELITNDKYQLLTEAQAAFQKQVAEDHPWATWLSRLGRGLVVLILTAAGTIYIARLSHTKMNPRRAWAVAGLLLVTLVIAKFVVSYLPQTTYLMGLAPTLFTAIILVITYNQRFALGVAAIHALLVTLTLGQNIDFFLTMLAGVTVFAFGLGEIRTRGKLIEVGFAASVAIFATVWALGLARMVGHVWTPSVSVIDTRWVQVQSLWAVCSGICVAMFALAVLPSIERIFRITTAMTLLELCDASKPLLLRLSQEAPGTFNHSLTVGNMAEAAGNAIGANGLLCRVGAYYHDVGKLSKPMYFIENQTAGQPNRHDKLSPAMSLLIIVGHVKDGIELAREYALPWVIHQFIAQHHGTTLVEYFFHAARKRAEQEEARSGTGSAPMVSETEFRYPGPKPQTREAAIVMICDGCESIVRAIEEPTQGRIEAAVHNLIMKRLMDGQFNECDLTLRELSAIEETLVRALAGIHHGRVPYPAGRELEQPEVPPMGLSQPA